MPNQSDEVIIHEKTNYLPYLLVVLVLVAVGGAGYYWWQQQPVPVVEEKMVETSVADRVRAETALAPEIPVAEEVGEVQTVEPTHALIGESMNYTSPKSMADMLAFYKSSIEGQGGVIESTISLEDREIVVSRLSDGRAYVVTIETVPAGGSKVSIEVEKDLQSL